ncbi:MAG: putative metallopeptidase [Candidatus Aenigmatarchaeota archaeon]|nr:metallopeptidase [Candidatus Aenigmarchaeota archaeon]
MKFEFAEDIKERISNIIEKLDMKYIDKNRIFCIRSFNSKSNAYARIWALSKVWQKCLNIRPHYIIEILSQHFDKLSEEEKDKILIHELMHIPKNFSGAILSHNSSHFDGRGGRKIRKINKKEVENLYKKYISEKNAKDWNY